MDFSNRSTQSQPAAPVARPTSSVGGNGAGKYNKSDRSKLARIAKVAAVALVAILLVAVTLVVVRSGGNNDEQKYVDSSKLQAVFLNTGQVYFGKITTLNSKYFVVEDIYYLQTSSAGSSTTAAAANTSVSLVKLGCELHSPRDEMVINRAQVTFWENLQATGQVAKAVATFQKANPSGQKCSDQSAAGTSTNNVQGAPSTTPTSSTTTTKP
ncbi:MAG: hypothetical protein ABI602_01395 [Candidatus Saccharibacteria bacterium]